MSLISSLTFSMFLVPNSFRRNPKLSKFVNLYLKGTSTLNAEWFQIKNQTSEIIATEWFGELTIQKGDPLALELCKSIFNSFKVVFISFFGGLYLNRNDDQSLIETLASVSAARVFWVWVGYTEDRTDPLFQASESFNVTQTMSTCTVLTSKYSYKKNKQENAHSCKAK